jgi:hypothetical protein
MVLFFLRSMCLLRGAELTVSPTNRLNQSWQGLGMDAQTLHVEYSGGEGTNGWSISSNTGWLSFDPSAGTATSQVVTVYYHTEALQEGTYTGRITVAADDAASAEVEIIAQVDASSIVVGLDPLTQRVAIVYGQTNAATRYLDVWNAGSDSIIQPMGYTLTDVSPYTGYQWITLPDAGGTSSGEIKQHTIQLTNLEDMVVGIYTGLIEVYTSGMASNDGVRSTLLFEVMETPPVPSFVPSRISLVSTQGASPANVSFKVYNNGGGTMNFTLESDEEWLLLSPTSGTARVEQSEPISAWLNSEDFEPGTYRAYVSIDSPDVTYDPNDDDAMPRVSVGLTVMPYPYAVGVTGDLSFAQSAGSGIVTQPIYVSNTGGTNYMDYTISVMPGAEDWLTVHPTSGAVMAGSTVHNLVIDTDAVNEGQHQTWLTVSAPSALSAWTEAVTLTLRPRIKAAPNPLDVVVAEGEAPADQTLHIWNAGSSNPVPYALSANASWFSLSSTNGTASDSTNDVILSFYTNGLYSGIYHGSITMTASNQTLVIPVTLTIGTPLGDFEERLVFTANIEGDNDDLWSMRPDGSDICLVADESSTICSPCLSPDGRKVFYSANSVCYLLDLGSGEKQELDVDSAVWLNSSGDLIGTSFDSARQITTVFKLSVANDYAAQELDWSQYFWQLLACDAAGDYAWYSPMSFSGTASSLRRYKLDNGSVRVLVDELPGIRDRGDWRPDNTAICYTCSRDPLDTLTVFDLASGSEQTLAGDTTNHYYTAAYSPTGDRIATVWSEDSQFSSGAIAIVDADSGDLSLITDPESMDCPRAVDWGIMLQMNPALYASLNSWTTTVEVIPQRINEYAENSTNFYIQNTGNSFLNYSMTNDSDWLLLTRSSGTSTGEQDQVELRVRYGGMDYGTHTDLVTLAANSTNSPIQIPVHFTVEEAPPNMNAEHRAECEAVVGSLTKPLLTYMVWNEGGGKFIYTGHTDTPWIKLLNWAGTISNNIRNVRMTCDPAGMSVGTYTGLVTIIGNYSKETNHTEIIFNVIEPEPIVPLPGFIPMSTNFTIHRYEDFGFFTGLVFNAGNGGTLEYYVTDDADWLQVRPESSSDDMRAVGRTQQKNYVWLDTSNLTEGSYAGVITVYGTNASTSAVVRLHVDGPRRYELRTYTNGIGSISLTPAAQDNLYAYNTRVTMKANPANGYTFKNWVGPVSAVRQNPLYLDTTADMVFTAVFSQVSGVSGTIRNEFTGDPIEDATVRLGMKETETDEFGRYQFNPDSSGITLFTARRAGYSEAQWAFVDVPEKGTRTVDADLKPTMIRNVRARQIAGTSKVSIYYDLVGKSSDRYDIDVQLSSSAAVTGDVSVTSLKGNYGANVRTGKNRIILWDASRDIPGQYLKSMRVTISAEGRSVDSPEFTVIESPQQTWTVGGYIDLNENGEYDVGELFQSVEVFYENRTNRVGYTGTGGLLTINKPLKPGLPLFLRRLIYAKPAPKANHGYVDNTLYTLYMDSDLARQSADHWDGCWYPRTITEEDVQRAQQGLPILVELEHPLFVWNFTTDFYECNTQQQVDNLARAYYEASKFLYRSTDGYMKLGKMYVSTTETVLYSPDIIIFSAWDICSATVSGAFSEKSGWRLKMQPLTLNRPGTPSVYDFYRALVHEIGHYVFGMYDEYKVPKGRPAGDAWGWKNTWTNVFPANYGVMDGQITKSTFSSCNDYIPDYHDYVPAAYEPGWSEDERLKRWVTDQIWVHDIDESDTAYSCWNTLKRNFETNQLCDLKRVPVRIMAPTRGYFKNGSPTLPDRPGPFFGIMSPYEIVEVAVDGGSWEAQRSSFAKKAMLEVQVVRDGQPVPGARVALRCERGLCLQGKADHTGTVYAHGVVRGDTVIAWYQGRKVEQRVGVPDLEAGVLQLEFAGDDLLRDAQYGLSTNRLAFRMAGDLMMGNDFFFTIYSSMPLQAVPAVTVHYLNGSSNTVAMSSLAPAVYSGMVTLTNDANGFFEISMQGLDGQTLDSLDDFELIPVVADTVMSDGTVVPSPDLRANNTTGLVYLAHAPIPMASGDTIPTNQVGAALMFTVMDAMLDSNANATATLTFDSQALVGLDLPGIRPYYWNDMAGGEGWNELGFTPDIQQNEIRFTLENAGYYALLTDPATDTNAPSSITNLMAWTPDHAYQVALQWTAPGDDGNTGTAAVYEVRYAVSNFTVADWDDVSPFYVNLTPSGAGTTEQLTLTMPEMDTLYYLAVRALDDAGNMSPTANVVAVRSGLDDSNADGISDYRLNAIEAATGIAVSKNDDTDGDGLNTFEELQAGTDPTCADTDADGMPDGYELEHDLDPLDPSDADLDPDGDTLTNAEEAALLTDPQSSDTDGDGMPDNWELDNDLDPLTAARDDGGSADPDSDDFENSDEYIADTDPNDGNSFLRLLAPGISGSGIVINWQGGQQAIQYLQYIENPATGSWSTIRTNNPPTSTSESIILEPADRMGMFRIEAER